jgi:hypothetical protein
VPRALTIKTLWPQLAHVSFKTVNRIDAPVIFFLGRRDCTCPWPIAEAWMKRLYEVSFRGWATCLQRRRLLPRRTAMQ